MAAQAFTFLLFVLFVTVSAEGPNPSLRISHGLLQGTWKVSTKGRPFASFQGIPYARPPVGKYRFREPQQTKPWTGTWDATKVGSACLQYDPFVAKITGSENCLFVNVFTPQLSPAANLPVVVYIHGGAFMYGEGGIYDPTNIMDRDLVVVTLNYRLGPLGFLSTGDEVIPGNAGLKDQSLALHWVRNNIMMFGGNPDSITLTGCSAGGASVHYHYLSPLSRGTFHRGIAFSGSAFAPWTHAVKPVQKARALAALVGCPLTTNREIQECLKYRPAEALVDAQVDMMDWKVHMFTPFTPTAEKGNVREPFLREYPYQAAMDGNMAPVPLITSVTSEEGLYPAAAYQADPSLLAELEANWQQLASNIFEYNDTLPLAQRADVAAKIKAQYLNNKPVSQETFPQLVQALGDRLFASDVGRLAQLHARKSRQPVFVYRYSYRAATSLSKLMAKNDVNYGVSHADDVFRLFKFPGLHGSAEDAPMTDALLDMLYSYASTGVPRLTKTAPEWKQVTPGDKTLTYLQVSSPTNIEMKASEDFGHNAFWDSLGFLENANYYHSIRDEL